MREVELRDGRSILIITQDDISGMDATHRLAVKRYFGACRAKHQIVVVLVSPRMGRISLPLWMRDSPLRPYESKTIGGCWIMEQDEKGMWIK